jgi:hypothetical protein
MPAKGFAERVERVNYHIVLPDVESVDRKVTVCEEEYQKEEWNQVLVS